MINTKRFCKPTSFYKFIPKFKSLVMMNEYSSRYFVHFAEM